MVLVLTYESAVLYLYAQVQDGLEERKTAGRFQVSIVGTQGNTPNERVPGDVGWRASGPREANSKAEFEDILRGIDKMMRQEENLYLHTAEA